jgi:hypothetical protein
MGNAGPDALLTFASMNKSLQSVHTLTGINSSFPSKNVGRIYRSTGQSQLFAKRAGTDSAKLLSSLIYFLRSSFGTKNALQMARMFEVSVG